MQGFVFRLPVTGYHGPDRNASASPAPGSPWQNRNRPFSTGGMDETCPLCTGGRGGGGVRQKASLYINQERPVRSPRPRSRHAPRRASAPQNGRSPPQDCHGAEGARLRWSRDTSPHHVLATFVASGALKVVALPQFLRPAQTGYGSRAPGALSTATWRSDRRSTGSVTLPPPPPFFVLIGHAASFTPY